MKFESRFNLGQKVFWINNVGREKFIECPSCTGGFVILPDGRNLNCPRCQTKGAISERHVHRWVTRGPMTVGQIRVQVGGTEEKDAESYMCEESGVGSGSIYYARDLYPTVEAAQEECDLRNRVPGTVWACIRCNPEFEPFQFSGFHEYRHCPVHGHANHLDVDASKELIEKRKQIESERDE